jgi:hypothetical protein
MLAQDLLLKNGVTAVADMGTSAEGWMTFRRAGDEGRLRLRIMADLDPILRENGFDRLSDRPAGIEAYSNDRYLHRPVDFPLRADL